MENLEALKRVIMERTDCTEEESIQISGDLSKLSPELRSHLEQWLNDESYVPNIVCEGYSFNSLNRDFGMSFTGALLTLQWLLESPMEAKKALTYGIR